MKWQKLGQVIDRHASYPVVERLEDCLRLYYCSRIENKSNIFWVDVDIDNQTKIINDPKTIMIEPGLPGTFDCDGVAPRCITSVNGEKRLYTIGWNKKVTTPYQLAVGVAVEKDGKWIKMQGPVLDRDFDDPYFCTSACVIHKDKWMCWYCSCTDWVDGKEPVYLIKYAESEDGFRWKKTNDICINYDQFTKAIGWPMVWIENNVFNMIYSYRSDHPEYRTNKNYGYRLGYAESKNGINWHTNNDAVGLHRSNCGWDSEMMAYTSMVDDLIFYNGNGFGKTGIGVARRVHEEIR